MIYDICRLTPQLKLFVCHKSKQHLHLKPVEPSARHLPFHGVTVAMQIPQLVAESVQRLRLGPCRVDGNYHDPKVIHSHSLSLSLSLSPSLSLSLQIDR